MLRKAFALLLLCIFGFSLCPAVGAVPTEVFFFEDTYQTGLPNGYSGSGFWNQDEKACVITGTSAATTEMNREFTAKGEVVTLSATFVLNGTANMQMRLYDGSTMFQQIALRPNPKVNSTFVNVRKPGSGYQSACNNPDAYRPGLEYSFEIEINLEKNTGKIRFTKNDGS